MSIYHPYACLRENSHIIIRHVKNQKESRLSRSRGNVNLTDFWFSILDSLATNNKSCSCQNIVLLSDISLDEDENWWICQDGKRICIGFLKIAKRCGLSIEDVMKGLSEIIGKKGKIFRTLDNADIIVVLSMEEECSEELKEIREEIIDYEKDEETIYFSSFFVCGSAHKENEFLRVDIGEKQDKREEETKVQFCARHARYEEGWCAQTIDNMVKQIENYKKVRNKKMMSYHQALLQILNVLGQYEQEEIRKDLFYIFYPPISTFIPQLEESEKEVRKIEKKIRSASSNSRKTQLIQKKQEMNEKIERSITQFLETMELLMHHIGQSCEEIIWNTGHGGMPYDIPLRISLMYISFLNILSDVLVEDEKVLDKEQGKTVVQRREFVYCLSPLAYTQPATTAFDIGNTEETKLIRVNIPRHILFMPRPFLVILAHEASHYAHESSRNRAERAKCMRKVLEYAMHTLLISPDIGLELDGKSESEREILQNYLHKVSGNVQEYLEETICNAFEMEDSSGSQKYQLDVLTEWLHYICQDVFQDEEGILQAYIKEVNGIPSKKIKDAGDEEKLNEAIGHIQAKILKNLKCAIHDEKLHLFLDNMKRNFREIYADFSAIRLLQLSWEDYLEAYIISESCSLNTDEFPPETLNRFAMVKYILEKHKADGWEKEGKEGENEYAWHDIQAMKRTIEDYVKKIEGAVQSLAGNGTSEHKRDSKIENDWFYFAPFLALEVELFSECDDCLQKYIKEKEEKKESELILLRNLYKSFAVRPQNEDGSFEEFFAAFDALTDAYKGSVEKKYEHDIQTRKDSLSK